MKCVIAFSCLLAVASAGFLGNAAYGGAYNGALGYANHGSSAVAYNAPLVSATHGYAGAYNGALGYAGAYNGAYNGALGYAGAYAAPLAYAGHGSHAVAYNAPLVAAPHPIAHGYAGPLAHAYAANTGPIAHSGLVSEARLVDPVAIAAGAPLPTGDTVEVASAKAAHLQAHAVAKGIAHSAPIAHGYAAHAVAPIALGYAHAAPVAHGYAHAGLATQARLVDPIAIAAGAPLPTGDTVEVAAAKALHYQAHVAAKAGHYLHKRSPGYLNAGVVAAPLAYAAPIATVSSYSTHIAHPTPLAYSSYAAPLAYSGYGYGGHVSPYYG